MLRAAGAAALSAVTDQSGTRALAPHALARCLLQVCGCARENDCNIGYLLSVQCRLTPSVGPGRHVSPRLRRVHDNQAAKRDRRPGRGAAARWSPRLRNGIESAGEPPFPHGRETQLERVSRFLRVGGAHQSRYLVWHCLHEAPMILNCALSRAGSSELADNMRSSAEASSWLLRMRSANSAGSRRTRSVSVSTR